MGSLFQLGNVTSVKPPHLYLNEYLRQKNALIAKELRLIKNTIVIFTLYLVLKGLAFGFLEKFDICVFMSELDNLFFNEQCLVIKNVNELTKLKLLNGSFSVLNLNVRSLVANFVNFISMNSRGGGVLMYVRNDIAVEVIDNLTNICDSHESLFIRFNLRGLGKVILGGIYRPPSGSIADFNIFLVNTLNDIRRLSSRSILI
ncbi:hypothetical protein Avbf_10729 [Armadillidium vulgare]|nr:hypothetical protein Avbf_10729 [Armadillidium vulgare]